MTAQTATRVKGLVTLITGGASGLGRGCAERLLSRGSKVVLFDLPTSAGEKVAKEMADSISPDVVFCAGNVTSDTDVAAALRLCKERFGKLSVLVNCAAIGTAMSVYNVSEKRPHPLDQFETLLKVNVTGTFNAIRQSIGLMLENGVDDAQDGERGLIVQTSGTTAFDGQQGQAALAAACGALNSMTLPLARDCSRFRIRVVTIAPGLFRTPLTSTLPEKVERFLENCTPFPSRFGQPSEFGQLVESIIDNRMINGEVIRIDGALRLPP